MVSLANQQDFIQVDHTMDDIILIAPKSGKTTLKK
jgi:hypothetical protein